MRKKIEFMADRIEAVLTLHKVPGRVTGGTVTPRWVRFVVLPQPGVKISRVKGLSEELAAALDVPGGVRVCRTGASLTIEVPRDDPQPVHFLPLMQQLADDNGGAIGFCHTQALLGLAEDGAPLLIRIASPDVAHILIAGNTGAGKTMLMNTMITSMAMVHLPPPGNQTDNTGQQVDQEPDYNSYLGMILIDPKGHAFTHFDALPHLVRSVITTHAETTECLESLVRLMERRGASYQEENHANRLLRREAAPTEPRVDICVFIDELVDYLMVEGDRAQWALTRLLQRGREAGIHIIAATQKPTAAALGPLVKANFPVRLVGRVVTIEDARTSTGWSGTGAERLAGSGDFLAIAEGRVIRFQTPFIDLAEIDRIIAWIVQGGGWANQQAGNPRDPSFLTKASVHLRHLMGILRSGPAGPAPAPATPPTRSPAGPAPAPATPPTCQHILPPPPPPPPDEVDILVQRLQARNWRPEWSIRAACRALGLADGGASFARVRQAVERLRQEAPAPAPEPEPAQKMIPPGWIAYECPLGEGPPISLAQSIMGDDLPDDQQGRGEPVSGGAGEGPAPATANATATATATGEEAPPVTPPVTSPPFADSSSRSRTAPPDPACIPPSQWMEQECLHPAHSPLVRRWLESLQAMLMATTDVVQAGTAMLSLSATAKQAHDDDILDYLAIALSTLMANLQQGSTVPTARDWAVDSFTDVLDAAWIGMGH